MSLKQYQEAKDAFNAHAVHIWGENVLPLTDAVRLYGQRGAAAALAKPCGVFKIRVRATIRDGRATTAGEGVTVEISEEGGKEYMLTFLTPKGAYAAAAAHEYEETLKKIIADQVKNRQPLDEWHTVREAVDGERANNDTEENNAKENSERNEAKSYYRKETGSCHFDEETF